MLSLKNYLFFSFLVITSALCSLHYDDFVTYQNMYKKELLQERVNKYLLKYPSLTSFIRFEDEFLVILNNQGSIEYKLAYGSKSEITSHKKVIKKIAIDPGHFGGEYAELEFRFLNHPKRIEEGTLTFLTAIYLKELLEKEGFEVMLTRDGIGKGAYPLTFFQWLDLNPEIKALKKTDGRLFNEFYNSLDLDERAKKINEFAPDITIVIHYNADDNETDENFNLMHCPGAFRPKDLVSKESRIDFLRLLVTDNLDESILLCQNIIKEMTLTTSIMPVDCNNKKSYLSYASICVSKGVFARDLRLTRLIRSPLCYGETLLQNNTQEAIRLSTVDTEINGIPASNRVKEVALGYYYGILNYCKN
jgi:hypothetical protein